MTKTLSSHRDVVPTQRTKEAIKEAKLLVDSKKRKQLSTWGLTYYCTEENKTKVYRITWNTRQEARKACRMIQKEQLKVVKLVVED